MCFLEIACLCPLDHIAMSLLGSSPSGRNCQLHVQFSQHGKQATFLVLMTAASPRNGSAVRGHRNQVTLTANRHIMLRVDTSAIEARIFEFSPGRRCQRQHGHFTIVMMLAFLRLRIHFGGYGPLGGAAAVCCGDGTRFAAATQNFDSN